MFIMANRLFKSFFTIILIIGISIHLNAKDKVPANKTAISSSKDDSLVLLYKNISNKETDKDRRKANEIFAKALTQYSHKDLYNAPFDSLRKTISILDAPDNSFRLITWTVYYIKGVYDFYGYILYKQNDSIISYTLTDNSAKLVKPEEITTTNNDWYGALYYKIIKSGTLEDPYYVVLGWDGNDLFTNRKIIDVLWFDENYLPNFGKPVFQFKDDDLRQRVIFEFAETASMEVRYEAKYNMIVFDHLSPDKPEKEGHHDNYGSDFSFDALKYDDFKWTLIEDIDIRNKKTKQSNKRINK
jgi:hypothetical protein